MRVLDLFAGIGGMSLGLERVGGFETVAFCEIDTDARAVLRKHWPGIPIHTDVRTLSANDVRPVDVITGGFPCQDVSKANAGGAGLAGPRSGLWAHFHRLIVELEPQYVLIENVAALRSRGLAAVLTDLWEVGYDAEWHIIPASAVGASHTRERLWIIAYPASLGIQECLAQRSESFTAPPEKPGFSDGWLSERLATWIRSRVVPEGHALPTPLARAALRQYGNAVVPDIPEALGRAIIEHSRSTQ